MVVVLLLLELQAGCSAISVISNARQTKASQRRRLKPAPNPKPSRLSPLTGSRVAYHGPRRSKLPLVTGRAVVAMLSTADTERDPEGVTSALGGTHVPLAPVGNPVTLKVMVAL